MARKARPLSDEELAEINEQYHVYEQEALLEPMSFVPHDTDAHLDDAMRAVVTAVPDHDAGLAMGYKYWCLMELLAARKGHMYDVSTEQGWTFLSIDMSTCGVVVGVEECRSLVETLAGVGLLSQDVYRESGRVMSERVCRNAQRFAKGIADKKIGAWKTNRAKAKVG